MKERLLDAYFVRGEHVGRIDDLAEIAAELGFDRADVVRSLSEDEYLSDVRGDQAQAIEYGIQGVPFFVIDGKYGISGAQDATVFAQALAQVSEERSAAQRETEAATA
jgi:predicted DsbA family dithiol-disulfide isomerase